MKLNSHWPPNFLGQGAACECSSASKESPFFKASLRCYEMPWNRRAHRGRIKALTNNELERYSQDQQSQSRKSPYLQNNGPHSFCPVGFQSNPSPARAARGSGHPARGAGAGQEPTALQESRTGKSSRHRGAGPTPRGAKTAPRSSEAAFSIHQ